MSSNELITVDQAGVSGPVNMLFRQCLADRSLRMQLGEVAAGRPENIGQRLGDIDESCPDRWADKKLISLEDLARYGSAPVVFSGLRPDAAAQYETPLAKDRLLVSNASPNRMNPEVPLLNPYFNGWFLDELYEMDLEGQLVAGGNCLSNIGSTALAAIEKKIGIESLHLETLQGWSGAGKLAVPEGEEGRISDIPGDEKEKIQTEPNKFLGESMREPANIEITADPKRAPWVSGHHVTIKARLAQRTSVPEIQHILRSFHAPAELEAIKGELQALTHERQERWPRRHQPIRPVRLQYQSLVRWDTDPIKLTNVLPMRVKVFVKEVDEADPQEVIMEAAGDNRMLGAVGNNILNIMWARLKGYI